MRDTVRKDTYWIARNPLSAPLERLLCTVDSLKMGSAKIYRPTTPIPPGRNPRIMEELMWAEELVRRYKRIPKKAYFDLLDTYSALPEAARRGKVSPALTAFYRACAEVAGETKPNDLAVDPRETYMINQTTAAYSLIKSLHFFDLPAEVVKARGEALDSIDRLLGKIMKTGSKS